MALQKISVKHSFPILLKFMSIGKTNLPSRFHTHTDYEIYYFHHGKCNFIIGDRVNVLEPGDLLLMNGMNLHFPHVDHSQPYCRSIIHFDPIYAQRAMSDLFAIDVLRPFNDSGNRRIRLSKERQQQFTQLLATLNHLHKQKDLISFHRFHALFLDLLFVIYDYSQLKPETEAQELSVKEAHTQNLIHYMEEHYHEDLTLKQLEDEFHLNRHYLVKIFKEVTGVTIFSYLYNRRINQAKILFMLDQKKTVTDVCYETGFKHPAHFCRVFKQHVGCTPEQYKRGQRQRMAQQLKA